MTGPHASPPAPARRSSRLGWSLAAWLALSIGTCLAVLVTHHSAPPAANDAGLSTARAVAPASPTEPVAAPASPAKPVAAPTSSAAALTRDGSADWQLRLFFTATEAYYHGAPVRMRGCADLACRPGQIDLGRYPRDFVTAVRAQGSGRIGTGPHRGGYLDWDAVRGYWIDTAPRAADGAPLRPFASVISSTSQLSAYTPLEVLSCGKGSRAGWATVCARLRASTWSVATVAVPRGERTVRLYVGAETRPGFAAGPWADTFQHAVLRVG
jgi:hypothetical protein